jgi:Zn-dependent M28 family amino/carboxypeptidase
MLAAYQHGASACLILRRAGVKDAWGTNVGFSGAIADFPYLGVDERIADELMSASGIVPSRIKDGARVKPGALGARIHLAVTPVCDPVRKTYNIIGRIHGSDPVLKDQVVLVGAHYDHIGKLKSGGICRGADDNASGSSVVLEAARSIMKSGLQPRRTIVFALWTGEEGGLIGSNYFAGNPTFPLKGIVSNIEVDMVGTGTPGILGSTGAAAYPQHFKYIAQSAADLNINLKKDHLNGASDHLAFTRKNVPSSLIYAEGEHPYYHTVQDTPETLKPEVLESAAKLVTLSAWRAANS